jgi:DNA polymerase-3 subunit epsilon
MYLVFDTETTDLPSSKLAPDDPKQARVCQIAALLLDSQFKRMASYYTLIRPDGWTIKPGAQAAHGIKQELCEEYGTPIQQAFDAFASMASCADMLVAHSLKFDEQLMSIEASILGKCGAVNFGAATNFCTMLASTSFCRLPCKFPGTFKWPKLHEAYSVLCKKQLTGAHDALADVNATAEIFQWLVENKTIQSK